MATWNLDPETTHLNHGSFGASPVEVLQRQSELRSEMESNPVAFMLRRYQPLLEEARTAVSGFVGANPDGLVFVPNATYGVNSVLRSLEPRLAQQPQRRDIVVTTHTYNACRNAAQETVDRTGGKLIVADVPFPIAGPHEATAAVLNAVTPTTALVMLDHVTSATGLVMPVTDIASQLDPEVLVLVDGAHAPGMIDVAIGDLGVDFYTANCHKWMCSPKGAAFLWAAEAHRSYLRAAAISHGYNGGWPGSSSDFHAQFDWTGTDDPTARLCVPIALETLGTHTADGWPGIRNSNHALVLSGRRIVADALKCALPTPDEMIGSIASLPVPLLEADASGEIFDPLTAQLHEDWKIEVPVFAWPFPHGRMLRVSAQQYNTISDYERLAEALTALNVGFGS